MGRGRKPQPHRLRQERDHAAFWRRGDRHRGAAGGAAGGVELGQVGGQGCVIKPPAVEPGVELAEGALLASESFTIMQSIFRLPARAMTT